MPRSCCTIFYLSFVFGYNPSINASSTRPLIFFTQVRLIIIIVEQYTEKTKEVIIRQQKQSRISKTNLTKKGGCGRRTS